MRLNVFFRCTGLSFLILATASAALFVTSPACLAGEGTSSSLMGKPMPDFNLADTEGKEHSLAQYRSGKGVVLIFVSTRCPVSNAYNERMIKLAAEY